jgi:hypothetical protein
MSWPVPTIDRAEQLWSGVAIATDDQCWEWQRYRHPDGYGMLGVEGRNVYAHRQAWTLTNGEIPAGMVVCHRCDNPACCNPAHLFLGTQGDNIRDCHRKGRNRSRNSAGAANPSARLTSRDVEAIRRLYAAGNVTQTDLAHAFHITQTQVSKIILGRSWRQS